MTDDMTSPEEDDALAAEYVVGVLPQSEREAAQARMNRDSMFAQRVMRWETLLDGLNDDFGHNLPPARVKSRIDQRLFPSNRQPGMIWRWFGALATAFAVTIAVFFWSTDRAGSPDLQATLTGDQDTITVSVDQTASVVLVAATDATLPQNASFELWLVPDGASPVSLGTFSAEARLPLSTELPAGSTLAVSIEPLGGSPTGAPTGPVIAVGVLQDV